MTRNNKNKTLIPGATIYDDGTILLVRCPKCGKDNHALTVIEGKCAHCGYDAHQDPEVQKYLDRVKDA